MEFNTASTGAYEGYAVSLGYVRVLLDYLQHSGWSPEQICAPQRLSEIRASDSSARCTLDEWHALMGAAEVLTGDAQLALTLAEHFKPWHTGLVGFMAMTSRNLRDVGQVLARYHHLLNDLEAVEAGMQGAHFVLGVRQLTTLKSPRIALLTLGSWAWHARWLTGRTDLVFDVDLAFAPLGRPEGFERVFGGTVRFGCTDTAFKGARAYLDLPVIQQEPHVNRILQLQAQQQMDRLAESGGSVLAKLERLLTAHLGQGEVTLAALAAELKISPRTLQSRLEDSGLSFRSVVERVRKHQAERYLGDPRLSLTQIAQMLGFANQTSFHHAFKRWTGQSPGEFRRLPSGS